MSKITLIAFKSTSWRIIVSSDFSIYFKSYRRKQIICCKRKFLIFTSTLFSYMGIVSHWYYIFKVFF